MAEPCSTGKFISSYDVDKNMSDKSCVSIWTVFSKQFDPSYAKWRIRQFADNFEHTYVIPINESDCSFTFVLTSPLDGHMIDIATKSIDLKFRAERVDHPRKCHTAKFIDYLRSSIKPKVLVSYDECEVAVAMGFKIGYGYQEIIPLIHYPFTCREAENLNQSSHSIVDGEERCNYCQSFEGCTFSEYPVRDGKEYRCSYPCKCPAYVTRRWFVDERGVPKVEPAKPLATLAVSVRNLT